jgi:hypothetical protein
VRKKERKKKNVIKMKEEKEERKIVCERERWRLTK